MRLYNLQTFCKLYFLLLLKNYTKKNTNTRFLKEFKIVNGIYFKAIIFLLYNNFSEQSVLTKKYYNA